MTTTTTTTTREYQQMSLLTKLGSWNNPPLSLEQVDALKPIFQSLFINTKSPHSSLSNSYVSTSVFFAISHRGCTTSSHSIGINAKLVASHRPSGRSPTTSKRPESPSPLRQNFIANLPRIPSPIQQPQRVLVEAQRRASQIQRVSCNLLLEQLALSAALSEQLREIQDAYSQVSAYHKALLRHCSELRAHVLDKSREAQGVHAKAKKVHSLETAFEDLADGVVREWCLGLRKAVGEGRWENWKRYQGAEEARIRLDGLRRKLGLLDGEGRDNEPLDSHWTVVQDGLTQSLYRKLSSSAPPAEDLKASLSILLESLYALRLAVQDRISQSVLTFESAVKAASDAVSEHKEVVKMLNESAEELKNLKEMERDLEKARDEAEADVLVEVKRLAILRGKPKQA
ncbi:hypothetical protein T439DRAFT_348829 [Meredithblackwellia eburnea MCA 4105]